MDWYIPLLESVGMRRGFAPGIFGRDKSVQIGSILSLESEICCLMFLKAQSWGQYFSQSTQPLLVELSRGMG